MGARNEAAGKLLKSDDNSDRKGKRKIEDGPETEWQRDGKKRKKRRISLSEPRRHVMVEGRGCSYQEAEAAPGRAEDAAGR